MRGRLRRPGASAACWLITTAIATLGAFFGKTFVNPASEPEPDFFYSLARIDGANYRSILERGYTYQPADPSAVAFFPAYPLAARWLARLTGWSSVSAQLCIAHVCGLAAFVVTGAYLGRRSAEPMAARTADPEPASQGDWRGLALLAMGLLPTTFFFRMAYTESMFLLLVVTSLYGIVRKWPLPVLASVVGLATAVRPVGVALLLPMAWDVWSGARSRRVAIARLAYAVPLGCWGLLGYMIFEAVAFGEPLAFALTQTYHRVRPLDSCAGDKWLALLSWEPIRDTYDRTSPGYWAALHNTPSRLFSLESANPIYFVGTAAIVAWGAWKRWLTTPELLLAVPLLVIPYVTRAYEMRMLSQARFTAVVFPAYIVMGHVLALMPPVVAAALLGLSGLLMGLYAALFAAGYPFL